MRKIRTLIITLIFVMFISSLTVNATQLENLKSDATSGWVIGNSIGGHMGMKLSYYKYSSTTVSNSYSGIFDAAKAIWGSNINLTHSSSTSEGTVHAITDYNSTDLAYAGSYTKNSSGHMTSWKITIVKNNFDSLSLDEYKKETLAHEIGHVYGLGHYNNNTSYLMHATSLNVSLQSKEISGMKLCTHDHTHGSSTTYTYETYTNMQHIKRCTSCFGYYLEIHTIEYRLYPGTSE